MWAQQRPGLFREAKKVVQKVSVPAVCSYKGEEQPENICLGLADAFDGLEEIGEM